METRSSSQPGPAIAQANIFIVIVLYRQVPETSLAVRSVERALQAAGAPHATVLLYDNTPVDEEAGTRIFSGFQHLRAGANRGMLGAYEVALTKAEQQGCEWLLTLDQDTELPADYFAALAPSFAVAAEDPRIAAIVPRLAERGRLLSPAYVGIGRPQALPANFTGVPRREARAFNSGALLRVRAVQSLGAFDPCFWLDHLDSWLHHHLYLTGWRMYVVGGLTLQHQLSLLDVKQRVSGSRFQSFLGAEAAYIDLYGTLLTRIAYTAQLAVRWMRQHIRRDPVEVRRATRDTLLQRLTCRRQTRIAHWRIKCGSTPPVEAHQ